MKTDEMLMLTGLALVGLALAITVPSPFPLGAPRMHSDGSVAISFGLLGKTQHHSGAAPVYPKELLACDGRLVVLCGFAAPYDDPQHATKLLLTEASPGCFFCAPPCTGGVVLVRRSAMDGPLTWTQGSITFEGTLHLTHLNSTDEEANRFLFTIDGATVVND